MAPDSILPFLRSIPFQKRNKTHKHFRGSGPRRVFSLFLPYFASCVENLAKVGQNSLKQKSTNSLGPTGSESVALRPRNPLQSLNSRSSNPPPVFFRTHKLGSAEVVEWSGFRRNGILGVSKLGRAEPSGKLPPRGGKRNPGLPGFCQLCPRL